MTSAIAFGTEAMVSERPAAPNQTADVYLRQHDGELLAHLLPGPAALSELRAHTAAVLTSVGVDSDTAHTAELVVSELVGNAVRACGGVPVIVEVRVTARGIVIGVTDPEPEMLPEPSDVPMDNADADSGRGLAMLRFLCADVTVDATPFSKQVRCLIATP